MDDLDGINLTEDGIKKFVGHYVERVRTEQNLPELEWDLGEELDDVYFWLKGVEYEEPLSVPLNIRRATQPLEDLEAIKARIYSSFSEAARKLSARRGARSS